MLRLRSMAGVALIAFPAASLASLGKPAGPAPAQQSGQQIFESVCAACHSVQPPAKLAPPMSHVARHYLEALPDRDEALARIAAWVHEPAADRSLLPAHAIETWGIMPPPGLDPDQARTVAGFVLTLADSARGGGMAGQGAGMMRHGMMEGDTAMAGRGGMGRGMMMHHDSAGAMGGMGMGRGMMRRDTTDTTAMRLRRRGV